MPKKLVFPCLFVFLVLFLLAGTGQGRFIVQQLSSSDLVSDGLHEFRQPSFLSLDRLAAEEICEQTYGFLPCTTTVLGNIFLMIVYGYLMYLAAKLLSNGSELLLEVLGPGIIGGLVLPVLVAVPDALLMLVSGLSESVKVAQTEVLVGMGSLAGSTVMHLTVLWGSCVVLGKCDLQDSTGRAVDLKDTRGFSLTGSGVSTDIETSYTARIMTISVIPFIIVQLPQVLHTHYGRRLAILIALIVSVSLLISYCLYQVFQPWIQKRRLAFAKHKHVMLGVLKKHLEIRELERLLRDDGEPDADVIKKLFHAIDTDSDGKLSAKELRALIIGIEFKSINFDTDDAVKKILSDFDISGDAHIDADEFFRGISKWLNDLHLLLRAQSDESVEKLENPGWISFKAILMLLLGAAIAVAFADPLVDIVTNFSKATGIPSFFISFIVLPFATSSSGAVSALIHASRKKQRCASLTYSEIYGVVTMKNILCLSVFLALVYVRHMTWDFSFEVLVILIVSVVMGLFGSFRTTFPLWTCFIAFAFYPFSLVLVYVLNHFFGWS